MYHDDTSGRQVTLRPTLSRCSVAVQSLFSVRSADALRNPGRSAYAAAASDGSTGGRFRRNGRLFSSFALL